MDEAVSRTDPAIEAANGRVEATLEHARFVDLSRLIVGRNSPEVEEARRAAMLAGDVADRTKLIREARHDATEWVLQAFARRGYSGTWAATEVAMSVARPADRAAVAEALADAVTAAAVEDLVDDDTVETLRSRWALLDASSAIPEPGALNDLTRSIRSVGGRPGGRTSLVGGVILVIMGCFGFAIEPVAGLAFLIGGLVVLGDALVTRRR